jgi:hypothetical protein
MLTREQEKLKELLEAMKARSEDADKIQILSDALNEGLQIEPKDASALASVSTVPVIEFFLNHESCTVKHLMWIFKLICLTAWEYDLNAVMTCMKHAKFPANRKEYEAHGGIPLYHMYVAFMRKRDNDAGFALLKYMLEKHSSLILYPELPDIQQELLTRYKDNAEQEAALLLLCHHPDYWEINIFGEGLTSDDIHHELFPFFVAARKGYKDVFNYFYFHEGMSDVIKIHALKLSEKHPHLMMDAACHWFKSNYEKHMLTFYMATMCGENSLLLQTQDVVLTIIKLWMEISTAEFFPVAIKNESFKPAIYKSNPMVIFQKPTVTCEWLVRQAEMGVMEYFYHNDPSRRGAGRAGSLHNILENPSLPSSCKILAVYSVLNEITWVGTSRIKDFLKRHIGRYINEIEKIAGDYASENNLDLEKLKDNFASLLHGSTPFSKITGSELLKKIVKGAEMKAVKSKRL